MTKPTLKLLENNRKTFLALQQSNDLNKYNNNNNNKNDAEDQDMEGGKEGQKTIAAIIEEVVSMPKWEGKRASKLDLDDFLDLLAEFNKRGIHFA